MSMSRETILSEARRCVCGERQQDYGTPEDNFRAIAALWTDYLFAAYPKMTVPEGDFVSPVDVANMMALLKIARIATGSGTSDSFVDLAGYAACGGEIATRRAERTEDVNIEF